MQLKTMFFQKRYRKLLWAIGLIVLVACSELPCSYTNGVLLHAGFYYYDGTTLTDTIIPNIVMHYGLEEEGFYPDSTKTIYTDTLKKVQSLQFPLSMLVDSSVVIFEFDTLTYDTLVFHYNKTLHLESHECGFVDFFEITSIDATANNIDSVWISNNVIDYGGKENIKIYF